MKDQRYEELKKYMDDSNVRLGIPEPVMSDRLLEILSRTDLGRKSIQKKNEPTSALVKEYNSTALAALLGAAEAYVDIQVAKSGKELNSDQRRVIKSMYWEENQEQYLLYLKLSKILG